MNGTLGSRRRIREVLSALPEGWKVVGFTGKAHLRLRHEPTGAMMTAASSPGDRRELKNLECAAARAVRATEQQRTP